MSTKSLKSQVTMLMIVGLVLFIVVSLILYLSKSAVKKQSQQNIKGIQETAIDTYSIKEFVAKCLDKLAKDAVVLLGRQGGYIYISQGGTLVDYQDTDEGLFFVNYNNLNVAYNVLPPALAIEPSLYSPFPYSSEIPEYPWRTFPYRTATSNAEVFEGFFGINHIPPLNSSGGPNSIQVQIESFIDNNIASCLDFNIFEKQGFSIEMQPSKTSVIIGSGDVSVASKVPVIITNQATKEFTELNKFSTSLNIRLRDVYFFAKELIENDIKNIKFDIGNINNSKDFINIKLIENIFSNDDLIIITDEKSLISGKPSEYIFARRNRAPVLHYIRKTTLQFPQNYEIKKEDLLQNSQLKAEDPDEDNYTITITPSLPKVLNVPQIKFKVEVNDGQLSDYQIITINRI